MNKLTYSSEIKALLLILVLIGSIMHLVAQPNWDWAVATGGEEGVNQRGKIIIDNEGSRYITGWFAGTATFGRDRLESLGSDDLFVAKMNSEGNWEWAVSAGGLNICRGFDIDLDNEGNIYVTGGWRDNATWNTEPPTTLRSSLNNVNDIFVTKLNNNGEWQWVSRAGSVGNDIGYGIVAGNDEHVYLTGYCWNNARFGAIQMPGNIRNQIFAAKMNADSGAWVWVKHAGAVHPNHDVGYGIALDGERNVFITGYFEANAIFGDGVPNLTSAGFRDIFAAKLNNAGIWQWAKRAGGDSADLADVGLALSVDSAGNVYFTGQFAGIADFGETELRSGGGYDIFVAKIDERGEWGWAKSAGGESSNIGNAIVAEDDGNIYLTGNFRNSVSFGEEIELISTQVWDQEQQAFVGQNDIFVANINDAGEWQWVTAAGGHGSDIGRGIAIDDEGNLFLTGSFQENTDFGEIRLTSLGGNDIFIAKITSGMQLNRPVVKIEVIDEGESVRLSWEAVGEGEQQAQSYRVYASDNPNNPFVEWQHLGTTGNLFFDPEQAGRIQFYRVIASMQAP